MGLGEFAAIGAALALAVSGLIIKPISTKFSPSSITSILVSAGWTILTIILVFSGKFGELRSVTWCSAAYGISGTIVGMAIGTTLQIKSFSLADISKVYPITYSSWFFFTAVIATIFLGEPITYHTILGAILIASGITLLSSSSKGGKKEETSNTDGVKGIIFALLAGLCWAVGINLLKLALYDIDPLVLNVIRLPFGALVLVILTLVRKGLVEYRRYTPKYLIQIGVAGLLDYAVGSLLFLVAMQLIGAIKASILSSISPLFIAPLSIIFLKEKLTKRVILGIIICTIGISVIAL